MLHVMEKVPLMEGVPRAILFLLLIVDFGVAQNTTRKATEIHVGLILNLDSLVGKVARTSVSLAVEDFYATHPNYSTKLVLHIRDSMASDVQAASAGMCSAVCHVVWIQENQIISFSIIKISFRKKRYLVLG
jgi:ionotropic glutamate receptor